MGVSSMNERVLCRRAVVAGLPILLAGCSGGYRAITGEPHSVPFVPLDPALMRQEVAYNAPYRPGTVVVNVKERRLYLVQPGGRALRYAVGVGRAEALDFHGAAIIGRKESSASWIPTANMMRSPCPAIGPMLVACRAESKIRSERGPFISTVMARIPIFACMELTNRILIGTAASSGCIRSRKPGRDLYNRVPVGAAVVVLQT